MIKARFGHRIDGWVHSLFPFLFLRALNPSLLTLIGAGICMAAGVAFARGHFPLGGWLLLAGGFFDLVDGVVARHFDRSTNFGALLDSTMDRLVDMVVLFAIAMHYGEAGRSGLVVLAGIALVMAVLTSYVKARAEQQIDLLPGGILERGERVGLLALGAIFGGMVPALWVLAIGSTLTVAQRLVAAYRQLKPEAPQSEAALGEHA